MKKLQLFVCENFYPEYEFLVNDEGFEDVELIAFPSLCDGQNQHAYIHDLFNKANSPHSVIICNSTCEALKQIPLKKDIQTATGSFCFSHITSEEFIKYLISHGNYLASTGWLLSWKDRLSNMGLDEFTAKTIFQESSKQLVFFDAKINPSAEDCLKALSSYVGLPYLIVPVTLEETRLLLRSLVYEWRLHNLKNNNAQTINDLRNQCAEYSAVFDILGKLSSSNDKRALIDIIKNLFLTIFGAQSFKFWTDFDGSLPMHIKELQSSQEQFILQPEENRLCIKIAWNDKLFGIIDAGGFLFPQYIDRYIGLALQISKFCALVFYINEQNEVIKKTADALKYLSYHDSLTELHNRTYISELLSEKIREQNTAVFVFDIDRLKYVNDNFGHAEGDKLLRSFAAIMKKCFRETEVTARIGGDEFIAIIYDIDSASAESVKQRILNLIDSHNSKLIDKHLKLSVSIGYALSLGKNETIETLMKKADERMYKNKMKRRV